MKGKSNGHSDASADSSVVDGGRASTRQAFGGFDDHQLLRVPEVAAFIGYSERQVLNFMASDRPLPCVRIGAKRRVRVGDLRAWIRQAPIVGT